MRSDGTIPDNPTTTIASQNESVVIPAACPKRDCRSRTWSIPDDELDMLNQKRRESLLLGPGYRKTGKMTKKAVSVLDRYIPKKSEKKPLVVCTDCEEFYCDQIALENRRKRRHYGMCRRCHASNVYVRLVDSTAVCLNCLKK